ncbi:hypothetical protein DIE14_07505 [Burkholderia sp. Bp9017]|nr:hypothetical protein DIE14_07505 [Burkholderia sp. Bp9017]RQZ35901.1 hypothetical protein DIE13_08470 [Burkholderia sp. Bp9016]
MVPYRRCCNRRSAPSALAGAEPGKLRGFAGSLSGCPASRSFQGHSMIVDSYAYCPAAHADLGVFTPTPIERAGTRREVCR